MTPAAASPPAELSADETRRYARHLILPDVGAEGQRRLKQARVLLVGAGGLGSPAALYLAAAGVGTLGIVDPDTVDLSNLQRQILHDTTDAGRLKVESGRDRIAGVNPHVRVEAHPVRLTSDNARELVREYEVVVDGSDNFPTRYLVNDACVLEGRPNVYGSVLRWEGQASVFATEGGPCYRCLFAEPPPPGLVPGCAEAGVLGVLPGIIGSIQAAETIKLLLGLGDSLAGRLVVFDALAMRFREIALRRDPACPICGEEPEIRELIDYERFCAGSAAAADEEEEGVPEITVMALKARLDRGEPMTIIDVREPYEWGIANLEEYGARLIPLGELPQRLDEIASGDDVVLHCRSGARSAQALELLRARGYRRLFNLAGGILAWTDEVDPTLTKY
ncbi:molybdopterin-synthase adenylyltransferase MoeB [soil metagenome]